MNETNKELQRQTICQMIIAAMLLMHAVYWLRPVLVPFVVSVFVVSGISPLLRYLEYRLNLNRYVSIGLTLVCGLGLISALGLCLWLSVRQITTEGSAYADQISRFVDNTEGWLAKWNIVNSSAEVETTSEALIKPQDKTGKQLETFRATVDSWIKNSLATLSGELLALISSFAVVSIFVFFLLLGEIKSERESLLGKIDFQMRSYLVVKTLISAVTGVLFGLALWIFGVPMALTFGLLAFLLNYIPNFGPILASLLPVPFIVFLPDADWLWIISAISVSGGIQLISGNIVEPKLMGSSSGLHPITVMISLMFWGMIWGIAGMFLAVPMTAIIKLVLDRYSPTRQLGSIMAGEWNEATVT